MPHLSITKTFTFEAAHILPRHPGKCSRMHGHSYRLEVTLHGQPGDDGMIMDFDQLSTQVNNTVISQLDHQFLNDLIETPTAENVALLIWEWLEQTDLPMAALTVHETATSSATVST